MNQDQQTIAEKWNEISSEFDENHATEDLQQWRDQLEQLIGLKGQGCVLDIGTGTGFLALMLAELGYESYGIDFAKDMLAIGKQHAIKRGVKVNFQLGEGEKLPYPDNYFDVVVNSRVLWTLLHPQEALTEWNRVLKPGGKLLCFTRIIDKKTWEKKDIKVYADELENKLPLHYATEHELAQSLKDALYSDSKAIQLSKNLSYSQDLNPWYVIHGIK